MSALTIFSYKNAAVRTTEIDGFQWWVAKDVCEVLGLKNYRQAIAKLEDDEKGVIPMDTLGGSQDVSVINEPGLYMLIARCDKPIARPFMRWVTHEVLPQIRKTGAYATPDPDAETIDTLLQRIESLESAIGGPEIVLVNGPNRSTKAYEKLHATLTRMLDQNTRPVEIEWLSRMLVDQTKEYAAA